MLVLLFIINLARHNDVGTCKRLCIQKRGSISRLHYRMHVCSVLTFATNFLRMNDLVYLLPPMLHSETR